MMDTKEKRMLAHESKMHTNNYWKVQHQKKN